MTRLLTMIFLLHLPLMAADQKPHVAIDNFYQLLARDTEVRDTALDVIAEGWQNGYAAMLLDIMSISRNREMNLNLLFYLKKQTGEDHGPDTNAWFRWLWEEGPELHPEYADFKARLYGFIDPKFREYFKSEYTAKIRIDEVRWGGVKQDGIPPLRSPKMISAKEADYLGDDNVIFGVEINGDIRAYPKRILAWHEMFVDTVGGMPVAGVYCTLCGTVIIYETTHNGVNHELGTSGFLYRSNKLMYDKATQSLWNTIQGAPVIGPLADQDIELEVHYVVTTTWGEWRRRHPNTTVLSLDTGHERDYGEGVAYNDYFSTDRLMFSVPVEDDRLKNKAEVFSMMLGEDKTPVAIDVAFLATNPLYQATHGGVSYVVVTDESGAARAYADEGIAFKKWDGDDRLRADNGDRWKLTESALEGPDGRKLERLSAHRTFWFGWVNAHPKTELIK